MDAPSKALFVVVVLALATTAVTWRNRLGLALKRFFTEESGPFNLAVTRIVFFAVAIIFAPGLGEVSRFGRLPHELIFAPQNLGKILAKLPINDTWILVAFVLFIVSSALGLVGLLTRPAAFVFVVSGFYYLGLPQLYGKVNHYHHVIWFGLVFAVARSADTLSISAMLRPRRPMPSRAYALPLRFFWLLMGVLYLFAGLSKYRFLGLDWIKPETGRYWMHLIWWRSGHVPPFFKPDALAPLVTIGSAFTLVFEISFIFLVLFKGTRLIAAAAGLTFHNMTWFTLGISFWNLQALYVSLIDWERLSRWAYARRGEIRLLYDGANRMGRRTARLLEPLVPPGGGTFEDASATDIERETAPSEIRVIAGDRTYVGYDAYRRMAWRVPLLWPLIPVLALAPVAWTGKRIYRRLADRGGRSVERPAPRSASRYSAMPVAVVAATLLAILAAIGLYGLRDLGTSFKAVNGWPLATYPTFASTGGDTTKTLRVEVARNGRWEPVDLRRSLGFMSSDRYNGLMSSITGSPTKVQAERAMRALLRTTIGTSSGELWQDTVSIAPQRAGAVVSSRVLLAVRGVERRR